MTEAPLPDPSLEGLQPHSAPRLRLHDENAPAERQLLGKVLRTVAGRVRREHLETWFRTLDVRRADDREVEFTVTSQFVRDWLQRNFLTVLQDAVTTAAAGPRRVALTLRDEDGWDNLRLVEPTHALAALLPARDLPAAPRETLPTSAAAASAAAAGMAAPTPTRRGGNALNPNYTFDKFVVGTCNRLAHASALAIGENPGCAYNPLFVHGNVGLGKSHLLQAICHTVTRRDQNARVLYMSCEDFTNAFISAIQNGQLDTFRDFYRHADVLVIDDVQFLANKEKTQDEFFHTFNALYDAQKQIVLSSDRPPIEIPTIEERLVSRFKWGLVAEVEAPCFDTRAAIVRRKAMGRGIELPDEVAKLLAERVTSNIRELEGAVIKVVGFAGITGQPITLSLAEQCVRGMPMHHAQVSVDDVMTLVTTEFAISARELVGKSRTQTVSLPRQVAMFLLREHTENSLEDVGRIFGNRDHTTVLYAVTKIRERTQKDRLFKELVDTLSNRLLTRSFRS
ncbi:MAG: chromosomal replication initiator protein DnaA [Planctomycetes bacterium]|nr:chromosomal replication initiator protein DnaA [Planctomycetota bacterium]